MRPFRAGENESGRDAEAGQRSGSIERPCQEIFELISVSLDGPHFLLQDIRILEPSLYSRYDPLTLILLKRLAQLLGREADVARLVAVVDDLGSNQRSGRRQNAEVVAAFDAAKINAEVI